MGMADYLAEKDAREESAFNTDIHDDYWCMDCKCKPCVCNDPSFINPNLDPVVVLNHLIKWCSDG